MGAALKEWIEGSHFVSADGVPVILYHGTDVEEPFNIFAYCDETSLGFHFGSVDAAHDRLRQISSEPGDQNRNIIPVYCRATSPLVLNDLYTWGQLDVTSALVDQGIITEEEAEFVLGSASAEMLYAVIEAAGYDCVVYTNICEDGSSHSESLMIWRASLVKGVHSTAFDTNDPRILSQTAASEQERSWYDIREQEIKECRNALLSLRAEGGLRKS